MNRFRTGLVAATALIGAFVAPFGAAYSWAETPAATAAPAPKPGPKPAPKPAMWVIRDTDSTIYLFGSVHVMRVGTDWFNPDIRKAFDSAGEVWFEIPDLDDQAAAAAVAQKYMLDPTGGLTEGLTPDEVAQLDTLLKASGSSTETFKNLRKWAVAMIVTMQDITKLGYSSTAGVDVTLMAEARKAGKTVHGFETLEQQMSLLVPASEAEELRGIRAFLKDRATVDVDVRNLFDAWTAGDEAGLERFLVEKIHDEDADVYQRLLVRRNADWTPQIETILAGKGTVFIAVGAGHLVGAGSVINMLKKDGVTVERVRY